MPSSRALVATMTQSRPSAKAISAAARSSMERDEWVTYVSTPIARSVRATASTRRRDSTNTRRFCPGWSAAITRAALSSSPT